MALCLQTAPFIQGSCFDGSERSVPVCPGAAFEVCLDASELEGALDAFAKRGGRLDDAMTIAAEMLVTAVNEKFEASGPGWKPLAESTLLRRRGAVAQILVDTGRLAGSIHGAHGADFAEAATDVAYAVYHVSSAPRSRVPLRDFFELPEHVFDDILEFVLDRLTA
jgi:phage gpG-like protein